MNNKHNPGISRRSLMAGMGGVALAAPASAAFPDRPVRLVVPYAAGGGTDVVSRLVAQAITARLGQPVVVENRTGGGVVGGSEFVARAAPDGYTLLVATTSHTVNPTLLPSLPYDTERDFAPVAMFSEVPMALIVHPAVPAADARAFLALLRARPGAFTYGSAGVGSTPHLAGELLRLLAGVDILHVAYRGNGPALQDLVAGQIQFTFDPVSTASALVRSGSVRALAISTRTPSPVFPGVPTLEEAGVAGFDCRTWNAALAPARTPPEAVARLNEAIIAALAEPALRARFAELGANPGEPMSPPEIAAFITREIERWGDVVRRSGMRPA
ncbi:Bug family tripartite tricarboxylate transporter substrate binding protein [Siccirubricoccus phaeus]|uniref:Bug family tripartite tricarboxylate transporter substrate binding protein n=1 Tax=Siccirubricoccus phaeus TaxID=2595053 RepID=UPI0011F10BCF|nr:tripartite tricarboxylate transporter substrate binding protein [Siccirubricoccus phaeus]